MIVITCWYTSIKQEANVLSSLWLHIHLSLIDYYNLENGSVSEVAYYNTSHCAVTFTIDIQKVCVCSVSLSPCNMQICHNNYNKS